MVATQKSTLTSDLSLVVGRKTWRNQTNRGSRSERGGGTSGVNEGPKSSLRPRRTVITRAVKTCDPTPASPRTQSAAVNACYGWPGECANWPLCGAGAVPPATIVRRAPPPARHTDPTSFRCRAPKLRPNWRTAGQVFWEIGPVLKMKMASLARGTVAKL